MNVYFQDLSWGLFLFFVYSFLHFFFHVFILDVLFVFILKTIILKDLEPGLYDHQQNKNDSCVLHHHNI